MVMARNTGTAANRKILKLRFMVNPPKYELLCVVIESQVFDESR
jgi:hypothetical protein